MIFLIPFLVGAAVMLDSDRSDSEYHARRRELHARIRRDRYEYLHSKLGSLKYELQKIESEQESLNEKLESLLDARNKIEEFITNESKIEEMRGAVNHRHFICRKIERTRMIIFRSEDEQNHIKRSIHDTEIKLGEL